MLRLREQADEFLQLSLPEAQRSNDPARALASYDNLLWAIQTASVEALMDFSRQLWDRPYIWLPAPLLVAVFRLIGAEGPDDPAVLVMAKGGIAAYSGPDELANAGRKVNERLESLEQQKKQESN